MNAAEQARQGGSVPADMARPALTILVVCTANVCRSPMAEAVIRHLVSTRGKQIGVASRGVKAPANAVVHPLAVSVCRAAAVQIEADRQALSLARRDIQSADLVLVMETGQRRVLRREFPPYSGKVHLLGHWQDVEIEDPVGGTEEQFDDCLAAIWTASVTWLDRLRESGLTP